MVIRHWKQIGKVVVASWTDQKSKNHDFEGLSSLILCNSNELFLIKLWCATKSGFYMTIRDDQYSGWTEKLQSSFQSQSCTKKGHTHCLVICCPSDPLQLSESRWNHCIWEICSANQWYTLKTAMPAASIGQQKEPNSFPWKHPIARCTTNAWKVERVSLQSFASSTIFAWPLANGLPFLQASWQLFAGKRLTQPAGGRQCLSRVCQILKHGFLCYRNK